jgi:DNA-binding GntR family transcriptional regulator
MTPDVKLDRSLLYDEVRAVLVARIADGTFQPGDRLVETRIAQELGVSQGPVREALRELAAMRLVTTEPHRGARVRKVSPGEIAEAHQVRAALEEYAARAVAGRIDLAPLEAACREMTAAAVQGDPQAYIAQSVAFHRHIVQSSGNSMLLEIWDSLGVALRTTLDVLQAEFDLDAAASSHWPIVEALSAGDPDRAASVSRRHAESFAPCRPASGDLSHPDERNA